MRLTEIEALTIKKIILNHDPQARIFLFGSRTNPQSRGGDIDIAVQSDLIDLSLKISILVEIKEALGDQKVDLLVKSHSAFYSDPFIKSISKELREL